MFTNVVQIKESLCQMFANVDQILPGITRRSVLELASQLPNLEVEETVITLPQVITCSASLSYYLGSWASIQNTNAMDYIKFPGLTAEWLEPLIPVCSKLTLAALFLQTTPWRGLAQCFDFCHFLVSVYPRRV